MTYYIHPSAIVSEKAIIGNGTKIWHHAQIRERAVIGKNCVIGKNVYIDAGVIIGNKVKIQNNCSIYQGVEISDGVFIGPHTIMMNDKYPRSMTLSGKLKGTQDWTKGKIKIGYGASLGAGVIVLPDVTIGTFAMIGSGSVVTKSIPQFSLAYGNPARFYGKVDMKGKQIATKKQNVSTMPECSEI